MSALSVLFFVLPFPIAFMLHNAEGMIVQHRWMLTHRDALVVRFPRMRGIIDHLCRLNTKAYAIATLEELFAMLVVVSYVLLKAPCSKQVMSAMFIAYALHLILRIVMSIVVRGYVPGLVTSILLLPYVLLNLHSIWLALSGLELLFWSLTGIAVTLINLRFAHWIGRKTTA